MERLEFNLLVRAIWRSLRYKKNCSKNSFYCSKSSKIHECVQYLIGYECHALNRSVSTFSVFAYLSYHSTSASIASLQWRIHKI